MRKKLVLALTTLLIFSQAVKAQTFEFDQLKQIPSINESNMKIIAFSIQKLFNETLKEPEKNSTIKAVSESVHGFYDTDGDGKLNKVNPLNGKQFTVNDSEELQKNSRLLFNLAFDEAGNLVVPEKIYVISNRKEDQKDRTIKTVGLLAFELTVSETISSELSKVKLENLAKTDINSLTGGLNPVPVKIPFNLSYGSLRSKETTGKAIKNGDQIKISIGRYFKGVEEETKFVNMLKEQTEILDYKKGEFDFVIEESSLNYNIDVNILRDMIWSSQPKSFTVSNEKLKSFSGEGKKIKK